VVELECIAAPVILAAKGHGERLLGRLKGLLLLGGDRLDCSDCKLKVQAADGFLCVKVVELRALGNLLGAQTLERGAQGVNDAGGNGDDGSGHDCSWYMLMVFGCVYPYGKKVFQFFQTEKKFCGEKALSPKKLQNPAN